MGQEIDMDITGAENRDLVGNVDMFQSAVRARHQELKPPRLGRVLLALDGSNQDATARQLAIRISKEQDAPITVIYAYQAKQPDDERERYLAGTIEQMREAGANVSAAEGAQEGGHAALPSDQIVAAGESAEADLIVVPAPYMEDFEQLGGASVGSTLDLLMSKASKPLLVVRQPRGGDEGPQGVVLPMDLRSDEQPTAAAWAVKLRPMCRDIRVVAVVDQALIERTPDWVEPGAEYDQLDERTLAGLRRPAAAGLIAAIQRAAVEHGLGCRVSVRDGEFIEQVTNLAREGDPLIIVPSPRDPAAPAFARVQALVRASRAPVLLV